MTSPSATAVTSLDRVLLVCNPTAGSRDRSQELAALKHDLESHGLVAELVTDIEHLGPLAASLHAAGRLRAVIGCGGDGTVAEILNRVDNRIPVTVYPMGTANLLAGYFGIPRDITAMSRLVTEGGVHVQVDAGRANGRLFLLMVSCGLDADVVHRLHSRRRGGHISYFSWAQPIWSAIRRYTYPALRITCTLPDGTVETSQRARWAFAVNLPVYAARLVVAPEARADDGQLHVCTFHGGSLWHGLKYVGHVLLRRHQRLRDYACQVAVRVRIEADEPVPYQLDGDPGGMLPLDIEVLAGRLTLLVPSGAARRYGYSIVTQHREGAPQG